MLQGYAWADSTYLCVRIRYAGTATFTNVDNLIFMDLDASPATGYQQSFNTIGAELRWLNGVLYTYTGTGTDYTWGSLAGAGSTYQLVGNNYEMCVLRSAIGLASSVQQVQFFFEGVDKKGTPAWQDDSINYYPYPGAYLSFAACNSIGASSSGCANVPTITVLSVSPDQPISPASLAITVRSSPALVRSLLRIPFYLLLSDRP